MSTARRSGRCIVSRDFGWRISLPSRDREGADFDREGNYSVQQFASGWKRSYYGKGDVIVHRLNRDGKTTAGASPVFGANITILVYGDAFWPTYATGDN